MLYKMLPSGPCEMWSCSATVIILATSGKHDLMLLGGYTSVCWLFRVSIAKSNGSSCSFGALDSCKYFGEVPESAGVFCCMWSLAKVPSLISVRSPCSTTGSLSLLLEEKSAVCLAVK